MEEFRKAVAATCQAGRRAGSSPGRPALGRRVDGEPRILRLETWHLRHFLGVAGSCWPKNLAEDVFFGWS